MKIERWGMRVEERNSRDRDVDQTRKPDPETINQTRPDGRNLPEGKPPLRYCRTRGWLVLVVGVPLAAPTAPLRGLDIPTSLSGRHGGDRPLHIILVMPLATTMWS